ncbi:hypothetical protein QBC46DRAFT_349164 [Diplogelasinospora grovesii]|uniref:Integral membrane protein n=1 Tax=Diplogelasinospora grovesii TaxID=303347 RepID=A0AAN6S9X0_9PEZI|nr:hypothetical protein QBC46DRAFT_349164 [Diplogelasinospora grovesii]
MGSVVMVTVQRTAKAVETAGMYKTGEKGTRLGMMHAVFTTSGGAGTTVRAGILWLSSPPGSLPPVLKDARGKQKESTTPLQGTMEPGMGPGMQQCMRPAQPREHVRQGPLGLLGWTAILWVHTDTDNVVGKEGTDDSRGGGGGRGDVRIPSATNTLEQTLRGIARMIMRYPVWDVSYDVAIIFTLGSAVWVINGCFVWLPLAAPWTEFPTEYDLGGGVTAFIGATIFEIGSVLLMLEAVNENRSDCFGWALEEALSHESHSLHLIIKNECKHHHHDRHSFLRRDTSPTPSTSTVTDEENGKPDHAISGSGGRRWSWFPTRHELTTHYLRDIGFLACLSQMIGATIFWIAGFTGLPPIYAPLSTPVANGVYWLPQVVGGSGFIISSILFMVETQDKWWKPAPKMLGWHIGFWNLTGALGFTLCGALGFAIEQGSVQYAATLSTFVGSWAFLIGSLIQWYESLDKYPILVLDKVPGELEKLLGGSSESIA